MKKATFHELRAAIYDVLTEATTVEQLPQKYKFLGKDTAQAFHTLVHGMARDVANAKGNFSDENVKTAAADIGMSMGAHADDLLAHLVGQQQKQAPKAPPPSRSQSQSGQPALKKPTQPQ